MGILASLTAEFASYYKAILARSMFGMHALVTVWRTTVLMGVPYWALTLGVFMLIVEYIVTMWIRMGEEWPWVSPSTACYLITAVAALWVQKLESLGHVQAINGSYIATLPSTQMQMDFSASDWLLLTEQTMMVTIILSRWLLPKGNMTHKDLSSLLLLYLALSADILDFSTIFSEGSVVADKMFCYIILVVWTGSLVQFALVLTNTSSVDKKNEQITLKSIVCSSEIWQILVQIGLQDLPFLLIRVIALVQYQVFNFTIIFFVCKNSLVISLELYHLVAMCLEQRRKFKKRKARMKHLKSKLISAKDALGIAKLHNLKTKSDQHDEKKDDDNAPVKKSTGNTLSLIAASFGKAKTDNRNEKNIAKSEIDQVEDNNPDKKALSSMSFLISKVTNKEVNVEVPSKTDKVDVDSDGLPRSGSKLMGENNRQTQVNSALRNLKDSTKYPDGLEVVTRGTPPASTLRPPSKDSRHENVNRWLKGNDWKTNAPATPSSIFVERNDIF